MTNEIITQTQDTAMVSFIERAASDKDVDIEKFERLIELQNKERSRQAREAYYADMAMLQSEMPTVAENGQIKVNGQVRSRYAKHEDIVSVCRPLMQKYGFSFSAKTDFTGGQLIIEGIVAHKLGHTEETKMVLPFDNSGSKNAVQAVGSSVSYGRRYVFSMLFNVTTGEDDDGQRAQTSQASRIPAPASKEKISDARLASGIIKIKSGEYNKKSLLEKFDLTETQIKTLNKEIK